MYSRWFSFAAKEGRDPREDRPSYIFFQVTPKAMQAWGTVPEMAGRTLMRDAAPASSPPRHLTRH